MFNKILQDIYLVYLYTSAQCNLFHKWPLSTTFFVSAAASWPFISTNYTLSYMLNSTISLPFHHYKMTINSLIPIYVTVYRKTGHNAALFENVFLHLRSCWRPDIELSKFYRRSLSRSHYNRPNRSLPSALNNTILRNRSIFSRYYAWRVVPGFPVDGHICSQCSSF